MAASAPVLVVPPPRRLGAALPWRTLIVIALAAGGVVVVWLVGWRGSDVPAQLYRLEIFRTSGFAIWDNHWYAGHYLLSYSALFPPLGATIGMYGTAALAAVTAAWAVDRLSAMRSEPDRSSRLEWHAVRPCGAGCGRSASVLVRRSSGSRRARVAPPPPPAAGADRRGVLPVVQPGRRCLPPHRYRRNRDCRARRGPLARRTGRGDGALPLVIATVAFPDPGTFPFPVGDLITTLGVVAALWWIAPHEWRALRVGTSSTGCSRSLTSPCRTHWGPTTSVSRWR